MATKRGGGWSGPTYRIRVSFRVPLAFALKWCTDFSSDDGNLEGESYRRKVVQKTSRRVVFEDLEETKDGWMWSRDVVTLRPPDRWHMDGVGNHRDVTADYVLTTLADGQTQLDLQWRRRPRNPAAAKLTKLQRETSALQSWRRFRTAMERDYKRSRLRTTK
ncbi:MAG: hypothetical protein E6K13_09830 [Methanobacteriota archaeon]|nr:MAG: hypothetical protein E6K13_09830 [Euryarchaeota archaeon]